MEVERDGCGENQTPPSYASEKPSRHWEQPAVRLTWFPKRVQTAKDGKTFSPPRPSLRDPGCVQSGGGRTPLFITGATSSFSPTPSLLWWYYFYIGGGTNRNLGRKKNITERNSVVFHSWNTQIPLKLLHPLGTLYGRSKAGRDTNSETMKSPFNEESACNVGNLGSISGLGRSPGEENRNTLQYSCVENPMDRRAWQATVHGVTKNQTWLSNYHFHKKRMC